MLGDLNLAKKATRFSSVILPIDDCNLLYLIICKSDALSQGNLSLLDVKFLVNETFCYIYPQEMPHLGEIYLSLMSNPLWVKDTKLHKCMI